MDAILSNSTLFPRPPLLPLRTVNNTSSTSNLSPITTCFASSSSKKLVCFTSRTRRRRTTLWRCSRNNYSSTVTCGGGITEINETQFSDTVLKSDRPVLVEFVANWCGPCRLISPAMQWVAQEYSDRLTVVKIDHDANPRLIEEYKVYGLPTLILFKNGQEVPKSRMEGAITKVKLKEYVDALLDSVSVA